ncbi:MAG TPA: acetyl-CoA carboxylase biotin carboxyl carrier protein [Gaiellaceae bacterium]|nr:acetyl-CoA carboxylase biotin carboxyl carrier protein [Gaiellaceae bacterium]
MPKLVDTTIRVLGQEPLADALPTSALLELAGVLDRAGFAYLEISGGGVFDSAVRRGVESPWERIRALKARTTTPLALAVRGRFLVGSRPVGRELVRRFVQCAADSGIDVFRLHDPLNDADNLREAAEAIRGAGREFDAGLLYGSNRREALVDAARRLPEIGAARLLLHDPAGLLQPHRAGELVAELRELGGVPVGLYCQGAGGNALAAAIEAARAGADLIACAVYPVALTVHRVSAEAAATALAGIGLDPNVEADVLWRAADIVDEYIGDRPVTRLVPRISVRAAQRKIPVGIVSAVDEQLRARGSGGRLDEVLDEIDRVRREAGSPPLAAPIGQVVASQALINVLGANRYATIVDELRDLVRGRFGHTPAPIDPGLRRAVELLPDGAGDEPEPELAALRENAEGLAASEEELLLLALYGSEAEPLLRSIRQRTSNEATLGGGGVDQARAARIRELVRIVQESGIDEITVEEEGMRVSVRRTVDVPTVSQQPAAAVPEAPAVVAPVAPANGLVRVESPMVGTFYRGPQPGAPPFVEEGDPVAPGQTLCILEAMKLMNEVKAEIEGIVRRIHVRNAEPVEYGQLLLELEPLNGRPLDV